MHTISGEVIHGKALARKIGFPTANIHLKKGIVADGTYKVNIIIDTHVFLGAGVYREELELFEAHVFDFEGDLYGTIIDIVILKKIRENRSINSLEELKLMIDDDITHIKKDVFYGMTFGTFDKFHPGHSYYLSESRKYCEQLITIISTDNNVQKIKNHSPHDDQTTRKNNVIQSGIPKHVHIGEELDHLKCIKQYAPKVICLGYDQEGFIGELEAYIEESGMITEIIRIGDYKPEVYKSSKM